MSDELTPSQVAARIGATTRTVQRWIVAGKLPARRVGARWRVAIDALDDIVQQGGARGRQIDSVFVANRGEIATRIARTCRQLGIDVILPATEGATALDLLDVDAVVAAATDAGADALHPGFGFLAENAGFATAVEGAGIAWIGPPPAAIRRMGDKAAARRLATSLGVPVIPGYDDPDQADAVLDRAARKVGYPLVVKPAAGGGGKGMRTVRDSGGLADAIASARREARVAFGDDRLILERYLEGPRHVEIQVLCDTHGNGVHLGERDCSIQRRHQKILEETPSPAVDDDLRGALGEAALRLARAVDYVSAGTCEFLVDDRGTFYFLEMNTRLQVEHPITELVTGRDLVADQIRIARGDQLGIDQSDVRRDGHAIEVRLYAEDAEAGFLPATGRVEALRWPSGEGIRVDAGIELGSEIGGRFDPMLAKIVAHGRDRQQALERLSAALDATIVLGLVTNLRFLRWLIRQPVVLGGQARIDTLDRVWPPDDWATRASLPPEAWSTAARLLQRHDADPWTGGWRLNGQPSLRMEADGESRSVIVGEEDTELPAVLVGDRAHIDVAGRSVRFALAPPPDVDRAARAAATHTIGASATEILSPMPGSVLAVHVGVGEEVEAGAPVATIEAMKMEHVVAAPAAGRVTELHIAQADQVARGQLVAIVEPTAEP
jgi:acetyl-CoA/propionyl-CoA carboxylase, biotin carboxylase, biotin carboxyl carrier protein